MFNAFDTSIQTTAEFIERRGQGIKLNLSGYVGLQTGVVTLKTELIGDGAAGVPTWADTLLPACGWVKATQTFSPLLEAVGSNVKTVTIGCYEDGVFKSIRGASANAKFTIEAGKIVSIDWMFIGAWVGASDVTLIAPTYPTRIGIKAAAGGVSVGGWAAKFKTMTIDMGNKIIPRTDPGSTGGVHSCIITDKHPTGSFDPESNLVATSNANVYSDWLTGVESTLAVYAQDAADRVTFGAPKFQRTKVQESNRDELQTDNIDFQLNDSSGNDSFTILFGAFA